MNISNACGPIKGMAKMSDFQAYLQEQLKDPEFRELWEAWREMIVRQTNGSMALSGLPLTEEDKERIRYLAEHPDEMDAMLEELIRKHTVIPEQL